MKWGCLLFIGNDYYEKYIHLWYTKEKITLYEKLQQNEPNSLNGSIHVRLDIYELQCYFEHLCC